MALTDVLNDYVGGTAPWRYVKSAFWLTSARIASIAISLVATFYIARALGPQNFGELSYAQSIVGVLALFSALTGALYRDVIRYPEQEHKLLGTAWVVALASALITSILALSYTLTIPHERLTVWLVAILCMAQFFSPFFIIQNVFYAKTETKWLSIANLAMHLAVSLLKIGTMILGHGVLTLAMIMIVEQVLAATVYIGLYWRLHRKTLFSWRFDYTYMRQLLADSLPIMIITASGMISARVDQIFLKHFLDTKTVGLYGVAAQLSETWQLLPGMVMTALLPSIVNSRMGEASIYRTRLAALGMGFLLYGLLLASFMTLGAHFIVTGIYGPAFVDSIPLVRIYIWSVPGMVLNLLVSNFLITENLRRTQILSAMLPMLLNVGLNLLLIPEYGAHGAAWATVISYSIAPMLFLYNRTARSILFSSTK